MGSDWKKLILTGREKELVFKRVGNLFSTTFELPHDFDDGGFGLPQLN